jgi:predicted nuclease of predicted toxin-antitoxin system
VRLLVDDSLANRVAALLADAGHDAIHVGDRELLGAPDETVLATAHREDRVVVTADTDFGTLLALSPPPQPSVILLRRQGRRAEQRTGAVLDAIDAVATALDEGALAVVEPTRVRVRRLPFDQG